MGLKQTKMPGLELKTGKEEVRKVREDERKGEREKPGGIS